MMEKEPTVAFLSGFFGVWRSNFRVEVYGSGCTA